MQAGTEDQQARAAWVLEEARRSLYGILAEAPGGDDDEPVTEPAE